MSQGAPAGRGGFRLALQAVLLATSGGAWAQSSNPPLDVPRPVEQPPGPSPFAAPQAPLPSAPVMEEAVVDERLIRRVTVHAQEAGATAVPPKSWVPPKDPSAALALEHRPGQPLDAAWTRAQFDRATAGGGLRPSSAVALVQLINRAFVTAGYINSGLLVAGADADSGTLDVNLVYGRLDATGAAPVTVEWGGGRSGGLTESYVRARFPSIRRQPLSAIALERDFRLLDESAQVRSISAALRPGSRPGEASLHLIVYPEERYDFYVGASNDRSPSVGGDRVFGGGYLRNLLQSGDMLSGEAGLTRGVKDGQLGYATPMFSPRLMLSLRGSFNNAAVVARPLELLDIRARDRTAEAGLTYHLFQAPLIPAGEGRWSASQSLSAGVHVMRRRQRSYLLGEPFSFAPGSIDGRAEFDAVRLAADYVRRDVRRVIAVSLGSTVGLDGTRSDVPGIPNPHRNFVAVLGQVNYAQRIGSGFELRTRLLGQLSRGTLYSGARLSVGGATTVRGYRESLFLVDRGVIGSVELARSFSLSGRSRPDGLDWGRFTASVFADGAAFKNAIDPQPEKRSIKSVGASLAWAPSNALSAGITYGHALTDLSGPAAKTLQDRGVHFRIVLHPAGLLR